MDRPQNKRDFTRVIAHLESEVIVEGGAPVTCKVDNVSLSGVMLAGGHGFTEGTVCTVRLLLGAVQPPIVILAKGSILRVRPDRCAIEFREIDGDSYAHLRNLVMANADDVDAVEDEFNDSFGIKRKHGGL